MGISPLCGSHTAAPIACDGFAPERYHAQLWLDGSIIVPIACHRRIGNHPMVIAYRFSLPYTDRRAVANVAYAPHISNRNVLDK